jgi:hypothetical protein
MTVSQDIDTEATMTLQDPIPDFGVRGPIEDFDPEKTLVREDWESTVIRRIAPRIAAVQSSIAEDAADDRRFGWESEGLRRLAQELQRGDKDK